MRRDSLIQTAAGTLLAGCLIGSSALTTDLSAQAGRAQLGYADRIEESDPPEVAIAIALGAFRGLFVNVLWLRATKLKEEGKFYESMELANTITRLQPRFPRVWIFQAWNMAYNISVATRTAEERWMWVKAGIDLLRSEGIPKNPNDMMIQRELAWIYNHKIQGWSDDANQYYKRRVAEEWTIALEPPPPRSSERTTEQRQAMFVNWLRMIHRAPATLEEAIEAEPKVEELVRRLREEAKLPLGEPLLRSYEYHRAVANSWAGQQGLIGLSPDMENRALLELRQDTSLARAWDVLLLHLRKRYITDELHMELPRMIRYTEKYGPLDWRHASSHALYWALRGAEEGLDRVNNEDFDLTNTDRLVLHAAQELFRWGDVHYDLLTDSYFALPSEDFLPLYGQLLYEELQQRARWFEDRARPFTQYGLGYENFLRDAVRFYYRAGKLDKAQERYEELRNFEGLNINDPEKLQLELSRPLEEFVRTDLRERMGSPQVAIQEIDGSLRTAYAKGLLRGDRQMFDSYVEYARWVHSLYMNMQLRRTMADEQSERMELFPREFEIQAGRSLANLLLSGIVSPFEGAQIYNRAPIWIQQAAYGDIREFWSRGTLTLPVENEQQFAQFFPEPPNYQQYLDARRALEQTDDRRRKEEADIEQQ